MTKIKLTAVFIGLLSALVWLPIALLAPQGAADVKFVPAEPTVAELRTSVVHLQDEFGSGGSGVVVAKVDMVGPDANENIVFSCNITVVTAKHVIISPNPMTLESVAVFAYLAHPHADIALALFAIPGECADLPYSTATLERTSVPQYHDTLVHIGFPRGKPYITTGAYIEEGVFYKDFVTAITSMVIGPGSSGGGVFWHGKLVGLTVAMESDTPYRTLVVPIRYLDELEMPL